MAIFAAHHGTKQCSWVVGYARVKSEISRLINIIYKAKCIKHKLDSSQHEA